MKRELHTTQSGRLAMTFHMQQALAILQMPQLELSQFLQEEIDKNPLLEEIKPLKKQFFEGEIASTDSLYENLTQQIRENFSLEIDRKIAHKLLESLDEKGFLSTPLEEIGEPISRVESVLTTLQSFDPPGIFAKNLQESLLIQLIMLGSKETCAFRVVKDHFIDLLHGRYGLLKKKLPGIDLSDVISKLALLNLRPLDHFKREIVSVATPDLTIYETETGWSIGSSEEDLPKLQIRDKIVGTCSLEEKQTLCTWRTHGKWLLTALRRRREILLRIGLCLTRHQGQYLAQKGPLKPLRIQELASELGLHASTISRALSGKYANTPRGILPLKSLLGATPETKHAKEILQELVKKEDKRAPLTDNQLTIEIENQGLKIARRTLSKYRKELGIRSASVRKVLEGG